MRKNDEKKSTVEKVSEEITPEETTTEEISTKGKTIVYGGNPFTPKQLYQGISKVSYSNIKWNRLKVDWKKLIG